MAGRDNSRITSPEQLEVLKQRTFYGRVKDNAIYPIALANLVLHGIDEPHIWHGNTLTGEETYGGLLTDALLGRAAAIEEAVYDLKAVNLNAKRDIDARTPEELLDFIEAKGREVADAIAALRAMDRS